jgi:hypothetical protein
MGEIRPEPYLIPALSPSLPIPVGLKNLFYSCRLCIILTKTVPAMVKHLPQSLAHSVLAVAFFPAITLTGEKMQHPDNMCSIPQGFVFPIKSYPQ